MNDKQDTTRGSFEAKHLSLVIVVKYIVVCFSFFGVMVAIYQLFHFEFLGIMVGDGYYYLLVAVFLPLLFLIPSSKDAGAVKKIPWYNLTFAIVAFIAPICFFFNAYKISTEGWEIIPPKHIYIIGLILAALVVEGARRAGGKGFVLVVLFFLFFPLFAEQLPGPLRGYSVDMRRLIGFFTMGTEGLVGLPMRVVGNILIGYLVFAVTLQATGGGKFFLDLASASFGGLRGGPAKMCIAASAFFGSISGSSISNVLTTGAVTIPTMKRTGYPPHYAGAIEAVASTGGVLMPPIMGVTAFVMADFLTVPYGTIVVAAIIPSLLYFGGLFLQVDAFAAVSNMKGLTKEELPSVKETLAQGWFHIASIIFLVWALLFLRWESLAPFWASLIMLIMCNIRKETRLSWRKVVDLLENIGKVLADLVTLLCAIGVIIGALSVTGVAHSFSTELIALARGNVVFLLILGALASFILGMGMTITACYVFLALILAPALVKIGLNPLAVHLFIMYWGMASYITPPVALSSFAGAGLAGANPMQTGFKSMQLGLVIYFVPFFFVVNPNIILQGNPFDILISLIFVFCAVTVMAYAAEGYLPRTGSLPIWARFSLFIGGVCLGFPWWSVRLMGLMIVFTSGLFLFLTKRKQNSIIVG